MHKQELSNEYLLPNFGVDTDENEPLEVHLIIKPWDLIFTEPPRPLRAVNSFTIFFKRLVLGCIDADFASKY